MGRMIPYIYYGKYKMFQTTNQIKDESINDMNMDTVAPRKSSSLKHRRMAPGCNCGHVMVETKLQTHPLWIIRDDHHVLFVLFVLSEALKRSWDGSCQTLPCCEFHLNFDEENLNIMEQSWNRVTLGPPLAGKRAADIWCEKQTFGTKNDMKCLDASRTVIKVVFLFLLLP